MSGLFIGFGVCAAIVIVFILFSNWAETDPVEAYKKYVDRMIAKEEREWKKKYMKSRKENP